VKLYSLTQSLALLHLPAVVALRTRCSRRSVRSLLLAGLLQLCAESAHLHHLQPRISRRVRQHPLSTDWKTWRNLKVWHGWKIRMPCTDWMTWKTWRTKLEKQVATLEDLDDPQNEKSEKRVSCPEVLENTKDCWSWKTRRVIWKICRSTSWTITQLNTITLQLISTQYETTLLLSYCYMPGNWFDVSKRLVFKITRKNV